MMDTGFWPALAKRFEAATGHRVAVVAKGNKPLIGRAFTDGEADLITMHASDMIVNFVADGYGVDPQPWARNDLVFVGPAADPAGIRGLTDAGLALRKIVATGSTLLIQRSLGAQQVLRNLASSARVNLDWEHVVVFLGDPERQMLARAAGQNAYVLVGRVPFRNGKIPNAGLELMVEGDPRPAVFEDRGDELVGQIPVRAAVSAARLFHPMWGSSYRIGRRRKSEIPPEREGGPLGLPVSKIRDFSRFRGGPRCMLCSHGTILDPCERGNGCPPPIAGASE